MEAIFFTSFHAFPSLVSSFSSCGFTNMKYPYTIVIDPKTIQRRPVSYLPKETVMFSIIGKTPGTHPVGFDPYFVSEYRMISSSTIRRNSAVYIVPETQSKITYPNSKAPIGMEEKHGSLLEEMMDTFFPPSGIVMDPYSGTIYTALGCLISKRG